MKRSQRRSLSNLVRPLQNANSVAPVENTQTQLRRCSSMGAANAATTRSRKDVTQRTQSGRRCHLNGIIPVPKHAGHQLQPQQHHPKSSHTLAVTESLQRSDDLNVAVIGPFVETLHELFVLCDVDENDAITEKELVILLHLMGMTDDDATEHAHSVWNAHHAHELLSLGMSFSDFQCHYLKWIRVAMLRNNLPNHDFIKRCKPLKRGFRKCDGDGNAQIKKSELEIALQKLDVLLADRELTAIFSVLDRDRDDLVDWSDFLYSVWHNTLSEVTIGRGGFFSIDLLAHLPSFVHPATQSMGKLSPAIRSEKRASQVVSRTSIAKRRHTLFSAKVATNRKKSVVAVECEPSSESSTATRSKQSAIERIGMAYIMRTSMMRLTQAKHASTMASMGGTRDLTANNPLALIARQRPLQGHANPDVSVWTEANSKAMPTLQTGFSTEVRRQIRLIETLAVVLGAVAGVMSGFISWGCENQLDVEDGSTLYYVGVVAINLIVSVIEVGAMSIVAVISAFQLTVCTNLKLYPQDAEREFLTRAIARAALQVGHRKEQIFGINPMKGSPRVVLLLSFLLYKGKRSVLKLLLKLLIKRVIWRAAAKSMLNLIVLPINAVMNAWSLRRVMLNCRVGIIGPPTATTFLERFFEQHDSTLAPFQRVDYVRVLGCALVCKRSVHPNLEIMLGHMRHRWVTAAAWPTGEDCTCLAESDACCPLHELDAIERFLGSLRLYVSQLTPPLSASTPPGSGGEGGGEDGGDMVRQHLRNIFLLLIVALIIDGSVDWVERRLYMEVCRAGRMQPQWRQVLHLKNDFTAGRRIAMETVEAAITPLPIKTAGQENDENEDALARQGQHVPLRESVMYAANRLAGLLAW